jgi:single-stranded DNA-binding protein
MTPLCKGKSIIMWGTCTSGPHVRTFDNGKVKTVFSLRYNQIKNDAGEKISDYIDIESWGNLARYAACVEKGDDILVAGEYAKDNYRSEKKGEDIYVVKASIILAQPVADEMPETEEEPSTVDHPVDVFTEEEGDDGSLPF